MPFRDSACPVLRFFFAKDVGTLEQNAKSGVPTSMVASTIQRLGYPSRGSKLPTQAKSGLEWAT